MSAVRPRRKATRRAKLLLLAGGLLVGWLGAEVLLAAMGLPAPELVFINKETEDWDCYCSNPRDYFVERQSTTGRTIYCVDHTGDPPRMLDLSDPKYEDSYKILTVGDSFTWGLGVKGGDAYPFVLDRELAAATGRPVAVSNYGQVGRMVGEIYEEMKQALSHGRPDLCIYGYVLNDPIDGVRNRAQLLAPSEKARGMDNSHIDDGINVRTANLQKFRLESPIGRLRQCSRVLDLALRQWEWRRIHQRTLAYYHDLYDPQKNSLGLPLTWTAIADMHAMQTRPGRRFLVVIFPLFIDTDGDYPFAAEHELIKQKLRAAGVETLDLLPVYRAYAAESLWVHPLDRHPNELAHRLAAEAIRDYVLDKGWITDSQRADAASR